MELIRTPGSFDEWRYLLRKHGSVGFEVQSGQKQWEKVLGMAGILAVLSVVVSTILGIRPWDLLITSIVLSAIVAWWLVRHTEEFYVEASATHLRFGDHQPVPWSAVTRVLTTTVGLGLYIQRDAWDAARPHGWMWDVYAWFLTAFRSKDVPLCTVFDVEPTTPSVARFLNTMLADRTGLDVPPSAEEEERYRKRPPLYGVQPIQREQYRDAGGGVVTLMPDSLMHSQYGMVPWEAIAAAPILHIHSDSDSVSSRRSTVELDLVTGQRILVFTGAESDVRQLGRDIEQLVSLPAESRRQLIPS